MASDTSTAHTTIQNTQEPNNPLVTINITNITKLTTTNYITWSLQIRSLLEGYDLYGFLDGSHPSPTSTITVNGKSAPNPTYMTWKRQDRLLFSALLSAVSLSIQPLLARNTTSQEAWTTLANTYAKPSCGHIKQIKDQLKNYVKVSKMISEYMQFIKKRADELALLGKPVDEEDLIDKILDGLGEEYKGIVDAVNAHETSISFNEIHKKLINKEASLQQTHAPPSFFSVTANPVKQRNNQS
ncbi:hypothetical protein FEM48_Zijuj06G0144600 [Ziziphus jujuba var. spinosa]|uniref:Retrovirus-related Pol polyprotein from transposon RE1 n=1 Tax=Ziziphus jujuba var. spinosa TaxID=714518 RepID=A0A978V9T8_ZIZJJ|nr:hypothetical protein FEM48_Zijuj06G0144600 [Ziziphus jujuba var. spinosa]